ncbi:hypothetical protein [Geodermatophilus maliterrae]|uniref:hypothetical protein n=1 Tax=Geodermatophilus maliterrae TaxID=3162531 RepID=UPI003F6A1637
MSAWMGDASAVAATLLVVVLLTAEAGLLIGVLLPSSSLVLGLGALAGAGAVPTSVAALSAAGATVLGAALGHRTATQGGGGALLSTDGIIGKLLPARIRAVGDRLSAPWVDAVGHRPVRAAAAAQFIAGARTLAPRIAAQAGVPLPIMLRGTAPAALLWSSSLVATGALASSALTRLNDAVAMLSVLVVVGATGVLIHRRKGGARRGRGQLQPHEGAWHASWTRRSLMRREGARGQSQLCLGDASPARHVLGARHRPRTSRRAASTWRNPSKLRCPADSPKRRGSTALICSASNPGQAALDGHLRTEGGREAAVKAIGRHECCPSGP